MPFFLLLGLCLYLLSNNFVPLFLSGLFLLLLFMCWLLMLYLRLNDADIEFIDGFGRLLWELHAFIYQLRLNNDISAFDWTLLCQAC